MLVNVGKLTVLFEFSANSQKIAIKAEKSLTYFYNPLLFAPLERWPSGRRRSPAKGVTGLSRFEGSNPSLSAILLDWHRVNNDDEIVRTNVENVY